MPQTLLDWARIQDRLHDFYSGTVDGNAGPKTWIALLDFATPSVGKGLDSITLRGRKLSEVAGEFGLTTAERVAGFLSNTTHETGDYTKLRENMFYKSAATIRKTWPSRFPDPASAEPFVRSPEALANKVYARPKEGNTEPGDGWRFRGGGDFQTTFRKGFRAAGNGLGIPLEDHPELIETPAVALMAGLFYWKSVGKLGPFFDAGEPKRARSVANTGSPNAKSPIGWNDVLARYTRLMKLLA